MLIVCIGLSALVLVTSFPLSELVHQRDAISAAKTELHRLSSGNQSLQRQADALSQAKNIATIAHRDYDMVAPGQTAYAVLPAAGSPQSASTSEGHAPLDQGPVAPGSTQSQLLVGVPGNETGGTSPGAHGGAGGAGAGARSGATKQASPGLWGRVLNTLEFWR